ncbi:ATP-binding protein [Streptomyces sp. NBC_01727]|uniref:ATP-binding protein n=1 Tax=Streptomyces sp. NBC_01727 TaxID=2975924 RepID=UPI002E0EB923|nr:ATP-binding protein [Streptomyces sp. NBC_01727]
MNTTILADESSREKECRKHRLRAEIKHADSVGVHRLRRRLMSELMRWVDADAASISVLLSSELLTNAMKHARAPGGDRPDVALLALYGDGHLLIEVTDPDPRPPCPHQAGEDDENGRGFDLIDALATEWGVCCQAEGKTIWFTVAAQSVPSPSRGLVEDRPLSGAA